MEKSFWGHKSFVLITGASRGIGRGISIEFAKNVGPGSVFLLVARNEANLTETKSLIRNVASEVDVQIAVLDLSNPNKEDYLKAIENAVTCNGNQPSEFEHAILLHNAASIGNVDILLSQYEDVQYVTSYYNLNVISTILLNSLFFKVFSDSSKQRTIIQVTSLASAIPVKALGMYGAAKAARNMLMKCLAVDEPSVTTMSWAPGIVDTDMYSECERSTNQDLTTFFQSMRELGNVITTERSAQNLVKVLQDRAFKSGNFVDFYAPEQYHPSLKNAQE